MKVVVRKSDAVAIAVFENSTPIIVTNKSISTVDVRFGDLNSNNSIIYVTDVVPIDFEPMKYIFSGTIWVSAGPRKTLREQLEILRAAEIARGVNENVSRAKRQLDDLDKKIADQSQPL